MVRRLTRRPSSTVLLVATALLLLGSPHHAPAQPIAVDQRIAFALPAQPLDAALTQYFRLTGVQLLYDSQITAGRQSAAVSGSYAPREALRLILANTGLVVRYSRSNAAIIALAGATTSTTLVPLGRVVVREQAPAAVTPAGRLAYYSQIEDALEAQLKADPRTGRLAFQVVVELRIEDTGQIAEVRLHRGSGDRTTDRLLASALGGFAVAKPPEGLAQPLRISLKGRRGG